jgi:hypothetical protein
MKEEPGAKAVKEPPYWMTMWPFNSKASMLPTKADPLEAYIMFNDTPYADLIIYQNPKKMKYSVDWWPQQQPPGSICEAHRSGWRVIKPAPRP